MKWLYWIIHQFKGCPNKYIFQGKYNLEECSKCGARYVIGMRKSR